MSRKSSGNEYILSDLRGERKMEREEGQREEVVGERSLIKPPGDSSINSGSGQSAAMATGAGGELERAARKQFQGNHTPKFLYRLSAFAALGGFLFGYDTGVVSGALLLLKKEFGLNELWQELVVSATVGAAAISALSGGVLNDRFGRKPCILLASFFFTVGAVIMTAANDRYTLLSGRIVVGLGIGKRSLGVFDLVPGGGRRGKAVSPHPTDGGAIPSRLGVGGGGVTVTVGGEQGYWDRWGSNVSNV